MPLRPKTWNDDIRWLLARIAGIDPSDNPDSATIPLGIGASAVVHYVRGTHTNISPLDETTIQLPSTTRNWTLVGLTYHRTGGSASTVSPRLGQASGFTADGPDDRVSLGPESVASGINAVFCKPIPMYADSNYRVYLRPSFDAGADNDAEYQLWFEQGVDSGESTP